MSALPLNLIKGTRNVHYERLENTEDIEEVKQQIERIKSKVRRMCSYLVVVNNYFFPLSMLSNC